MKPSLLICLLPIVSAGSSSGRISWKANLPGSSWEEDDTQNDNWKGAGREFNVFGSRGGQADSSSQVFPPSLNRIPSSSGNNRSSRPSYYTNMRRQQQQSHPSLLSQVRNWLNSNVKNMPKLQCRVEPTTTLKIRKTFCPLKTIVTLGADFNTQLGVWQFKSSWEDSIIGGKLTLQGRELQLTKSWQLSVGAVEDLVTRLRFRAAVDLGTMKA